jgi:hypothetical protein
MQTFSRRALLLMLLAGAGIMLSSCSTSLRQSAGQLGAPDLRSDVSVIEGDFDNMSLDRLGPVHPRLWDVLTGTREAPFGVKTGGSASAFDDTVRLALDGPSVLKVSLISGGTLRQTVRLPFERKSNHLIIHSGSDFGWLPLGYRSSSTETALTAMPQGDLIVLHRYKVHGIVFLIGNAGDQGVMDFSFPRRKAGGGHTQASMRSMDLRGRQSAMRDRMQAARRHRSSVTN